MLRRAWWLLERTDVPHTMQKLELSSSRFSHSGQKLSSTVDRLERRPSVRTASSTAASSSAACIITRIRTTSTARMTKPHSRPRAWPNGT